MATDKLAMFMYGWFVGVLSIIAILAWMIMSDNKNRQDMEDTVKNIEDDFDINLNTIVGPKFD